MDSNHIHIFLEKILSTVHCPQCKKKVKISDISIQSLTNKTCIFRLHCGHCGFDSLAQAVINFPGEKEGLEIQDISYEPIRETEVVMIHDILSDKKKNTLSSFFPLK